MAASAAGREGGAMRRPEGQGVRGSEAPPYGKGALACNAKLLDRKGSGIILTLFCREEATRTPDPYVPNVVRYQLRYFSSLLMYTWIPLLRLAALFLWITPIFASLSILAKTAGAAA